ncbi:MAG TPA: FAD-binding oxidoreductase [Candidatus Limnocylindria bacterium]|nr:FAD-binding oxidoreductase [Candidatus Limnocylindria bacterium]
MDSYDVLVVGGGIAGVSVGYALAHRGARVLLVEAEAVLAHHTTGRSAAMFLETYGTEQTRRLAIASRSGFVQPPGLERSLLSPRGFLIVGGEEHRAEVTAEAARGQALVPSVRLLGTEEIAEVCRALRPSHAVAAVWEPEAADIDVMALHEAYVSGMRRLGGEVRTSAAVTGLVREGAGWRASVGAEAVRVDRVVNAAGAWGDGLAALAGVPEVGLEPRHRTAFTTSLPSAWSPEEARTWPMMQDAGEGWYVKPEGDGLLCSLAEEAPSPACDAKVRELDVALALERIDEATTLGLRHVRSTWAGLRTFAPDRDLVLGPDPAEPSFSWYVGLGGFGIQTAPAAGDLVAALALGQPVPPEVHAAGVDLAAVRPGRPFAVADH